MKTPAYYEGVKAYEAMTAREKSGEYIEWEGASETVNPHHDAPYGKWADFEQGFYDAMEHSLNEEGCGHG